MSLASRCTTCGTVFRVVQDQLRVSEGWVRCGRCSEVFNALDGIFELDGEEPVDAAAEQGLPGAPRPTGAARPFRPAVEGADGEPPIAVAPGGPHDAGAPPARVPAAATMTPGAGSPGLSAQQIADAIALDDVADPVPFAAALARPSASADTAPAADRTDAAPRPAFLRDAERAATWRRSPRRFALAASVAALMALLGVQALFHFRDTAAARWPGLRGLLAAGCTLGGCRIDAPRRIDDVAVESTSLLRAPRADSVEAFRLAVTLRNHGSLPVALPSVDLSLTDSSGQLVARRALAPADFRAPPGPLAPGGESLLQLQLSAGTAKVTGYTVEIFYP